MRRIRLAVLTALVLMAWSTPGAASATNSSQRLQAKPGIAAPFARTTFKEAAAKPSQQPKGSKPFLTRNPQALAAAKASPRASGAPVTSTVPGKRMLAGSPEVTTITGGHVFNGVSQNFEVANFGRAFEPPDTMAAAGPFEITETVNDVIAAFDKFSGTMIAFADLNAFFPPASGYTFTDPRILFDQESGRWFLSGLEFNLTTFASRVLIGVTQSASIFSPIAFYLIDNDLTHICDQPKMGVNSTLVSISCANFSNPTTFTGQSTFVINKAQMIAFQAANFNRLDTSPTSFFSITPAQSLTPSTTAWMAENDSGGGFCGSASLALIAATGVPPAVTTFTASCSPITATAQPVPAGQPGATFNASGICISGCINTDDDRITSAVYQNGRLWTGMTETCTPAGDTILRDCMRLLEVLTSAPIPILRATDISANGFYFYYPAVSMDLNGNLFVSYTASSAALPVTTGTNPEAAVVTLLADTTTVDTNVVVQAGGSSYPGRRWGDYSAVAPDPDPNQAGNVWMAAEDTAGDHTWNTVLAQLSFNPQVSSLSPSSGPGIGGQAFTIAGSFLNPGAKVSFGGHLATNVVVANLGTSLTGITPSSAPGAVAVSVINPDGKVAPAGTFTFNAPGPSATDFYFAEGNTFNGFNETLELLMPNYGDGTPATQATVTYQTESGTVTTTHPMTAGQVTAVNVAADVGPGHTVSARVHLPFPGIAERTLNFLFGQWHGSTDKVGAAGPAAEWDFAEGSTFSFFSQFLTLQNPDPTTDSNITINYFTDSGLTVTKTVTLPKASRTTVAVFTGDLTNTTCAVSGGVAQNCGVGPGIGGVSTQILVASGPNIVAERPFYVNNFSFGSGPIRDGHDAFGANAANTVWFFAEGTTISGFNAYLTLQNPGATDANTTITYNTDSGASVNKTLTLPAHSRTTLAVFQGSLSSGSCVVSGGVAQNCGVGPNVGGVSSKVTSATPIVVERPMYLFFNFGTGVVAGAHVVVGANALGSLFGFSASNTTASENDFLTIQNTGGSPAVVNITYYANLKGFPVNEVITVAPNSRFTVPVFLPAFFGGGIGPGFPNLGIVVSSNQPILVEKPTYNSNPATYGATDTRGFTPSPAF